jgi:hypothetical protein
MVTTSDGKYITLTRGQLTGSAKGYVVKDEYIASTPHTENTVSPKR